MLRINEDQYIEVSWDTLVDYQKIQIQFSKFQISKPEYPPKHQIPSSSSLTPISDLVKGY